MANDLLIFSIGPVQSSITASRRTQDMKTSSWILTRFAEAALQKAKNLGCEIVYPRVSFQQGSLGIPNRLVILTDSGACTDIAKKITSEVFSTRNSISQDVLNSIFYEPRAAYDATLWNTQVNEWLEIYWVGVPWDGNPDTYGEQFRTANLGIDARKTLRHYPATPQVGDRCTLCAIRSSLGTEDAFWSHVRRYAGGRMIREGEKLCAICTIKRFAAVALQRNELGEGFPSISSIAVSSFKCAVLQHWEEGTEDIVKKFQKDVANLNLPRNRAVLTPFLKNLLAGKNQSSKRQFLELEGAYLYPEFYQIDAIKDETGCTPQKNVVDNARNSLRELTDLLEKLEAAASFPHPYYAVLKVDGDHLGALLDKVQTPEDHKLISGAILKTAQEVKNIVEDEGPGYLIYSGGDDMLAFLPVERALEVAKRVRDLYEENLSNIGFSDQMASAGIVIAHHKTPLQSALADTMSAITAAKEGFDRNALVLVLNKRSGAPRSMSLHWSTPGGPAPLAVMSELRKNISSGKLSGKFAYDLEEVLPSFEQDNGYDLLNAELYRLIIRHHSNERWPNKGEWEGLAKNLMSLWDYIPQTDHPARVRQVAQWMLAMRFFAQGDHS